MSKDCNLATQYCDNCSQLSHRSSVPVNDFSSLRNEQYQIPMQQTHQQDV